MKKLLLTAVAVLAVLGAGVLSVRHYNQYQNLKNNTEQVAAQAEADASAEAEKRHVADRKEWVKDQNGLRVECEKGLAAYDSLTTFEKKALDEPDCGTVLTR